MKKIILITILLLLTSCEQITNTQRVENLETKNTQLENENIELEIKIDRFELEINWLKEKLEQITSQLEEKKDELEKQNNKIAQINSNENKFQNNINCSNYKSSIENDLTTYEQLLELFYSQIENTCIATIISSTNEIDSNGIPKIGYFRITNAVTWWWIDLFNCSNDLNCYQNFQIAVKNIK